MKRELELVPPGVFTDGTGAHRCELCHQMVRVKGGAPVVSLLTSDVEAIARLLERGVLLGVSELLQRLEQAAGRTVAQMKADQ